MSKKQEQAERDGEDLVEESADVVREALVQQLRLAFELKDRLYPRDLIVRSEGSPRRHDALSDYLFDLTRLSLHSYEESLRIADKHLPSLLDLIPQPRLGGYGGYGGYGRHGSRDSLIGEPPRHKLTTSAAPGEQAKFNFTIKNPGAASMHTAFTIPNLRDGQGVALAAPVTFERTQHGGQIHDDLALGAHETGSFHLLIQLPGDCAGGEYCGEVCVLSGSHVIATLDLHLNVRTRASHKHQVSWSAQGACIDFAAHNPLPEEAHVSFTTFELHNAAGHALPATISLNRGAQSATDGLHLHAHERTSLQLRLKPARNARVKAGTYHGRTYILIRDRTVAELAIEVEVPK